VADLVESLLAVPSVAAVARLDREVAGPRLRGGESACLVYYRGSLATGKLQGLGFEGDVSEPGSWGRLMNGGGSLAVEGGGVDLVYRDLGFVEHWVAEATEGRYEVDEVEGWLAGMATYVLAGELAIADTLAGELPRPEFPAPLRETAARRWLRTATRLLQVAERLATRGDVVGCTGLLAKAAVASAQSRLAERGKWALSETGIVRHTGLGRAEAVLAAPGDRPGDLERSVSRIRVALGVGSAADPAGAR
jgi:hypothetical protein